MKADGADLLISSHLPDTYSQWCNTTGLEFKVPGTAVSWDFPKQLVPSQQDHNSQIEKGVFLVAVADFFILKRGLKLLLRRVKVNYSSSNFHHVALLPRPLFLFLTIQPPAHILSQPLSLWHFPDLMTCVHTCSNSFGAILIFVIKKIFQTHCLAIFKMCIHIFSGYKNIAFKRWKPPWL